MNGIRNTYLYVCGSQRLLDIRRIYTSAGLIGLKYVSHISYSSYNIVQLYKNNNGKLAPY